MSEIYSNTPPRETGEHYHLLRRFEKSEQRLVGLLCVDHQWEVLGWNADSYTHEDLLDKGVLFGPRIPIPSQPDNEPATADWLEGQGWTLSPCNPHWLRPPCGTPIAFGKMFRFVQFLPHADAGPGVTISTHPSRSTIVHLLAALKPTTSALGVDLKGEK